MTAGYSDTAAEAALLTTAVFWSSRRNSMVGSALSMYKSSDLLQGMKRRVGMGDGGERGERIIRVIRGLIRGGTNEMR